MIGAHFSRVRRLATIVGVIAALVAGVSAAQAQGAKKAPAPSGRVVIEQISVAFIASGAGGGGRLLFKQRTYPFTIAGLGVGGIGASKLTATGAVYGLKRVSDFEGVYGQVRAGWALADRGGGQLYLQNDKGVILRLKTKREGIMLAMGADGVVIRFSR